MNSAAFWKLETGTWIALAFLLVYYGNMRHSKKTISELIRLRRRGYSIPELMVRLNLPKTTIWHHVRNIVIPPKYELVWRSKIGGSKIRKNKALAKAELEARSILAGPNRYPASLLAMLYWAEGNKANPSFTNTDPLMIAMFLRIAKRTFKISSPSINVIVRYFTGMNPDICRTHWAVATGIPKTNINMYYNDGGARGKSPFGICRINIRKGSYMLKVVQALIRNIKPL